MSDETPLKFAGDAPQSNEAELRRDDLYQKVGECLHIAQVLEVNITCLIAILNQKFQANLDAEQFIISDGRKTLGQLIHELRKCARVDDAFEESLKEALQARNYLTHHFYKRYNFAFSVSDIKQNAMTRLGELSKSICVATIVTQGFIEGFCEHFNISTKDLLIPQAAVDG